jgi:hypothetical protein
VKKSILQNELHFNIYKEYISFVHYDYERINSTSDKISINSSNEQISHVKILIILSKQKMSIAFYILFTVKKNGATNRISYLFHKLKN